MNDKSGLFFRYFIFNRRDLWYFYRKFIDIFAYFLESLDVNMLKYYKRNTLPKL